MRCNPQRLDLLSNLFAELARNSHVTRLAHPTDGLALPFLDTAATSVQLLTEGL